MARREIERRRHFVIEGGGRSLPFTNPQGGRSKAPPPRSAKAHAARLRQDLEDAANDVEADEALTLVVEAAPGFALALEALDRRRGLGPQLLSLRQVGPVEEATIRLPAGSIAVLERALREYGDSGGKKRASLVATIERIRRAAFAELWVDALAELPASDSMFSWEVWLRANTDELESSFRERASGAGIRVSNRALVFPGRRVVLAHGRRSQFESSAALLDCLAEVRKAHLNVGQFAALTNVEQAAWIDDLLARVVPPGAAAPAVTLLDTGVNHGHPLLAPVLAAADLHAYQPAWGTHDHAGHGTQMAGLAAYGELAESLWATGPLALEHRLESVKLLPPTGSNPPELYGAITIDGCAQAELTAPDRSRVFGLAIRTDDRSSGAPTSWSATLDSLASGRDDDRQRLICVAAGNSDPAQYRTQPDALLTERVFDPAQAWNAITVGAFTQRTAILDPTYAAYAPLAQPGGLSPTTTTSVAFDDDWPIKPDVVHEGGNVGVEAGATFFDDTIPDLRLLTTSHEPTSNLLTTTNATSAANAQVARLAARLMAAYPDLGPEAVRALIVHSARWTEEMLKAYGGDPRLLLRTCGWGVPDLSRAKFSASDALTIVIQDSLPAYRKRIKTSAKTGKKNSSIGAGHMKLYRLPWPTEALAALGGHEVRLRVTLSYFVEPNPGSRGNRGRFAYQSHALRFDLQRPTDTEARFLARINKEARAADFASSADRDKGWQYREFRTKGSVHSDVWVGTGADLAARKHLAVYPVGGWWRSTGRDGPWSKEVRFGLAVSIETDAIDVDLYTPVAIQLDLPIDVGV